LKFKNIYDLKDGILNFVDSLEGEQDFKYLPVKSGFTKEGYDISLGYSCFVIKILFILNHWNELSQEKRTGWINFINSYQNHNNSNFPEGSFIDKKYYKNINKLNISKEFKRQVKKVIYGHRSVKNKDAEIKEFIRAESKQAISTLYQIGSKNCLSYSEPSFENLTTTKYLQSLDWEKPWNAGGQYSALCVLLETQIKKNKNFKNIKNELVSFSNKLSDKDSGCYFLGNPTSKTELINGSMKILSGLDWINHPIHYPEKLIDFCLSTTVSGYGCDIVDIVYVLKRCSDVTNYKREQINDYFINIENIIAEHYFQEIGGFSYYKNKSQIYYYGLKISQGKNEPDLHGTTLLTWAISLIYDFRNPEQKEFNLLKP